MGNVKRVKFKGENMMNSFPERITWHSEHLFGGCIQQVSSRLH